MSKYYVPEPGEIRIGQTVEINEGMGWDILVIETEFDLTTAYRRIKHRPETIRIKRLDAADIEAEGWEKSDDQPRGFNTYRIKGFGLILTFWGIGQPIEIRRAGDDIYAYCPDYTIRNRLELRELMRQLGITKEEK